MPWCSLHWRRCQPESIALHLALCIIENRTTFISVHLFHNWLNEQEVAVEPNRKLRVAIACSSTPPPLQSHTPSSSRSPQFQTSTQPRTPPRERLPAPTLSCTRAPASRWCNKTKGTATRSTREETSCRQPTTTRAHRIAPASEMATATPNDPGAVPGIPADSDAGPNERTISKIPEILPRERVFPIQIGGEMFKLSGASISSDGTQLQSIHRRLTRRPDLC